MKERGRNEEGRKNERMKEGKKKELFRPFLDGGCVTGLRYGAGFWDLPQRTTTMDALFSFLSPPELSTLTHSELYRDSREISSFSYFFSCVDSL